MDPNLAEQLRRLPALLGAHVLVTGVALAAGLLAALPLGLAVARWRAGRLPVLGAAAVIQTVPSLALLALMVPLLGLFGFWPALVALALYSLLPILRNTVVALDGVAPDVVEAGLACGMTRRQLLWFVELPLAIPVILAGVRTAAVWAVGTATLTTPVGQPSLGNFIFGGLQTRNATAVLVGCVAAAALALLLDALLGGVVVAFARRSRALGFGCGAGLALLFIGGSALPLLRGAEHAARAERATATGAAPAVRRRLVVGAKTFTEQYILAELVERRLRAAGLDVGRADGLGSTVAFDALVAGHVDVYVDYTGTLFANGMKRREALRRWEVTAAVTEWLAATHRVRALGTLGFENAYAFAMRRDRAAALGIRSLSDLGPRSGPLRLGSDYEFFERPEWSQVRDAYGLRFRELVSFDSTFMYEAVDRGEVDVITAFSSDGRIAAHDLLLLDDPRPALPPYDAILLLGPRVADDTVVARALAPLVGGIPVERMREANLLVDRDHDRRTPQEAAGWLDATVPVR